MDKLSVEERLNDDLYNKEREIEKLKEEVDDLTYRDDWKWRHIKHLSEEENMDLPVPRLEIRYRALDKYNVAADYALVYKHLLGHIEFCPLGSTRCSSHSYIKNLDLPFRDGAHIRHEMATLKLPGYVVGGSNFREIEIGEDK